MTGQRCECGAVLMTPGVISIEDQRGVHYHEHCDLRTNALIERMAAIREATA